MNWKIIKIALLILLGLAIIIPTAMYVRAIDLSHAHRDRVAALPIYSPSAQQGEFRLPVNGMEFLVRVAGMQNDGPGVILLHGFPESSMMWTSLLDTASDRGYRVVAFDQRGYSPGARPSGKKSYHIDLLVSDVMAVADEVGFEKFHLVGHDWGSGVGWKATMDHPERIKTWTAMAIPHIGVFFDAVLNHPEQQKRSAYMHLLRRPVMSEFYLQTNLDSFYTRVEDTWTAEQIQEYRALFREQGALTATMNWYRAADFEGMEKENTLLHEVTRPTLFLWGAKDGVIAPEVMPLQAPYIKAPFQSIRLDCGHSLMQEKTDSVVQAVLKHWSLQVEELAEEKAE